MTVQSEKTEKRVEHNKARSDEPALRDPSEVLRQVFGVHGRLRYRLGVQEFNGACALIQPSEAFDGEGATGASFGDIGGAGAVWAWFVGSPRAFTFGFVRSSGWATRKMRSHLAAEFETVTGRRIAVG